MEIRLLGQCGAWIWSAGLAAWQTRAGADGLMDQPALPPSHGFCFLSRLCRSPLVRLCLVPHLFSPLRPLLISPSVDRFEIIADVQGRWQIEGGVDQPLTDEPAALPRSSRSCLLLSLAGTHTHTCKHLFTSVNGCSQRGRLSAYTGVGRS